MQVLGVSKVLFETLRKKGNVEMIDIDIEKKSQNPLSYLYILAVFLQVNQNLSLQF